MMREELPTRQEQEAAGMVWCERCGKTHNRITFTQEDYDNYVREQAREMARSIDQQLDDLARNIFVAGANKGGGNA